MESLKEKNRPVWFLIVDDKKQVRCSSCGKIGNVADFVYVEQEDGKPTIIIHRACIGEKWLKENKQGFPHKQRTAHRIWWIKQHTLKLVKG